jgi:hypothetical protein
MTGEQLAVKDGAVEDAAVQSQSVKTKQQDAA